MNSRRRLLQHAARLAAGWPLAAAAAPPATKAPPQTLLAVGTSFARLYEPGEGGQPATGLAVDLLNAMAAAAGMAVRYEFYPWLRAQSMIEHGQAQVLIGPYRTAERERRMRFSRQAFYEDALVFYARRREQGLWWGDFQALRPLRVALVQGWVYGERFEQARQGLQLQMVRDLPTGLRMLQLGRLDLLAANQRNTEPVLQALGLAQEIQRCQPPFGHLRGHFAFAPGAAGERWATLVDGGLQRLRASGELAQMAARRGVSLPD